MLAADHVLRQRRQSGFRQGAAVSFQAAASRLHSRPADVGDAAASLFNQVRGGQHADFFVLHSDHPIGVEARRHAVDQNVGNFAAAQGGEQPAPAVGLGGSDDQAVHIAGNQQLDLALFHLGIFVRVGDDDLVAERLELARYSLRHFGEKRMHQVRDHQADHIRTPGTRLRAIQLGR